MIEITEDTDTNFIIIKWNGFSSRSSESKIAKNAIKEISASLNDDYCIIRFTYKNDLELKKEDVSKVGAVTAITTNQILKTELWALMKA